MIFKSTSKMASSSSTMAIMSNAMVIVSTTMVFITNTMVFIILVLDTGQRHDAGCEDTAGLDCFHLGQSLVQAAVCGYAMAGRS